MDEKTPHIHAAVVPIVTGERRKAKKEQENGKRKYRKKSDTIRLCADDLFNRQTLIAYHDNYARVMAKYGLQRGVRGSEARHTSTTQYYRDMKKKNDALDMENKRLQEQKAEAEQELKRAKKEVQTEKLKGAATTAATNIAESVGSLFGNNKVKTLERKNTVLHREVAIHEETIETLQGKIQAMQTEHSHQLLDMQQKHINELAQTETIFKREISRLTVLLNKTLKWFPQIKDMINLERLCLAVGFNKEQTATLLTGKPIEYSGELYSEEHKRKFMAKDVKAKVFSDNGKFVLTIDLRPIGEWFKEQFEKLRQNIHRPIPPQQKSSGMKL